MAFSLASKTCLTSVSSSSSSSSSSSRSFLRLFALRAQSTSSHPNHPDSSDDSSSATDPVHKLEDVIHRLIVRRTAPDWLPFVPGSSYWVPPPRSTDSSVGIAQLLVEKLAHHHPLTPEEALSTTAVRGWPCSDFFIQGAPPYTVKMKIVSINSEAEATSNEENVEATANNVSKSENGEG